MSLCAFSLNRKCLKLVMFQERKKKKGCDFFAVYFFKTPQKKKQCQDFFLSITQQKKKKDFFLLPESGGREGGGGGGGKWYCMVTLRTSPTPNDSIKPVCFPPVCVCNAQHCVFLNCVLSRDLCVVVLCCVHVVVLNCGCIVLLTL